MTQTLDQLKLIVEENLKSVKLERKDKTFNPTDKSKVHKLKALLGELSEELLKVDAEHPIYINGKLNPDVSLERRRVYFQLQELARDLKYIVSQYVQFYRNAEKQNNVTVRS